MRVEIKILSLCVRFRYTLTCMRPFALTVVVSKKERPLSLSTSPIFACVG